MKTAALTFAENAMIRTLADNQYNEDDPHGSTWTFFMCETPSDKGVFGSLVKKGLAWTSGPVSRDDSTCGLTDLGRVALAGLAYDGSEWEDGNCR